MIDHKACPSHCCPIHGCKYGYDDCPVVTGERRPSFPLNNGCESCEIVEDEKALKAEIEAKDPRNIRISELEKENYELRAYINTVSEWLTDQREELAILQCSLNKEK